MRHAALSSTALGLALAFESHRALARCDSVPCADAEPAWLSPAPRRFSLIPDSAVPAIGSVAVGAASSFRLKPVVVTLPAPSRAGRDVNVIRYASDLALGSRVGLGNRLEVTAFVSAGLYQRGAGIKGVTDQSAPAIDHQSLHDPRLGFGYSLPIRCRNLELKLLFEAKLPLGNAEALSGEQSAVASPNLVAFTRSGGFFFSAELGARLRRPSELFGARIGSQALLALGLGYELPRAGLAFSLEQYELFSLVKSGGGRYLPAEWLLNVVFAPVAWKGFSVGLGGGGGLPTSEISTGAALALGVPSFRALVFARFVPTR